MINSDLLTSDLILSRANLTEIAGDTGMFWGLHAILNKLKELHEPLLFLNSLTIFLFPVIIGIEEATSIPGDPDFSWGRTLLISILQPGPSIYQFDSQT